MFLRSRVNPEAVKELDVEDVQLSTEFQPLLAIGAVPKANSYLVIPDSGSENPFAVTDNELTLGVLLT